MNHEFNKLGVLGLVVGASLIAAGTPALGQQARWLAETDPTAKYMIDMERQWAESGCTHQPVEDGLLAHDFQGTAPSGKRYNKAEALPPDDSVSERQCLLEEAKVHLLGHSVAVVYGSEHAMRKPQGGTEAMRCLVWTDAWLKRDGKWRIVAAQDTAVPCK